MKKLLLILIVLFSIGANAQYHRGYERRPIPSQSYYNLQPERPKAKINILPILGIILTTSIISNELNDIDDYNLNSRELMKKHYYQNQLELERLEYLQRQSIILERQHYNRERGFLGIFPKRHHRF
jgi:hypothetical protein